MQARHQEQTESLGCEKDSLVSSKKEDNRKMADKELTEKIAKRICTLDIYVYGWEELDANQQESWLDEADGLIALMKEAGYHKVSGEPPVLSDEGIVAEACKDSTYCQLSVDIGNWAAKTQRDADIRYYKGG